MLNLTILIGSNYPMINFFRKSRNPPAGEAGKMADDGPPDGVLGKPLKYKRVMLKGLKFTVFGK